MAQMPGNIAGTVSDNNGNPLFSASIGIDSSNYGTVTDELGKFTLKVPANHSLKLRVHYLGYSGYSTDIFLIPGETINLKIVLQPDIKQLEDVQVLGIQQRENTLVPIDIRSIGQLPNSSGNLETIIKTLPGVASGNELSSQYSVRGGSFDENLVYVNDIEIQRPLLIQSAQQEGLSFVNPALVSSIQFSAGGFGAEFGDKLSSVLDINYKQPTGFGGSASASLLGGSVNLEGSTKNNRFTHITGIRYKSTKFLLKTLDIQGDLDPSFLDIQTFYTYDLNRSMTLSFLGNYSSNKFYQKPEFKDTDYGNLQQSYTFRVYYEGEEKDFFESYLGALALDIHPTDKLSLKLITSAFNSNESITFDLIKQYWIGLAVSSSNSGLRDSLINIGVGTLLDHARDYLTSTIYTAEHKGTYVASRNQLKWGISARQEIINDQIEEWQMLDSAGYSLPASGDGLNMYKFYKASINLSNYRYSAYIQNSLKQSTPGGNFIITIGIRSQFATLTKHITVSPRGSIAFIPENQKNLRFHISSGLYHQPAMYKELRDRAGNLYLSQKPQRSWHIVGGADYNFQLWRRMFLFSSEIYYKQLTNVVPYKMDNLRLMYLPMYHAKAYAMGIDFRVYGEFVPGEESWFSLSLMKTREDIYNDFIINPDQTVEYPGYYRRPTDQWLNFSLFFQDNLPSNPNYKFHLLLNFGSGFPYSGPLGDTPSAIFFLDPYRRIDIGFSRLIPTRKNKNSGIKSLWIGAEILNIIDARNKMSLEWVRTVESNMGVDVFFGVPNYLTGRMFNIKLTVNL